MKKIICLLAIVGLLILAFGCASTSSFKINDKEEFNKIVPRNSKVKKLAGGFIFTEGPVWISEDDGDGFLIFSDIQGNKLRKWSSKDGVSIFREISNHANGNTLDLQGRLITCEHGSRTVTRTDKNGKITTLISRYKGKKLNSPNDPVVKSDGTIWFTDPTYGLLDSGERKEQPKNYVFRLDPETRKITPVVSNFSAPNGICFSPDEKKLYIADTGEGHIRVFNVKSNNRLDKGKIFCDIGMPDGIRCDSEGRLYSSAMDGVHIFSPDGSLIGKILVPEMPANLGFGGENNQTLFITARTSLYAVKLKVKGK
ncbi:MAG: SMP-30/gluconolactonase/LRE family protein [Deltaproteobacteria bacterium]|nr:SMP-30/gluconolactonase/LRE family protein [Deltaproteobacteria bacterium]